MQVGHPLDRPRRRASSTSPTTSRPTTSGPGGLALARSVQYLAPGVVLAVVDPGVGTDRRAVAVEVGDGAVGPRRPRQRPAGAGGRDGRRRRPGRRRSPTPSTTCRRPAPTFAGRDVFAPAAAHLCAGVDLAELGELIDPVTLLPGVAAAHRRRGRRPRRRGAVGRPLRQRPAQRRPRRARRPAATGSACSWRRATCAPREARRTYGDLEPGEVGLVVDSYGLALGRRRPRARRPPSSHLAPGDEVTPRAPSKTTTSPASSR